MIAMETQAWAASSPSDAAKTWLLLPLGLCRKSAAFIAPLVSSYLLAPQNYISFTAFFHLGCMCLGPLWLFPTLGYPGLGDPVDVLQTRIG